MMQLLNRVSCPAVTNCTYSLKIIGRDSRVCVGGCHKLPEWPIKHEREKKPSHLNGDRISHGERTALQVSKTKAEERETNKRQGGLKTHAAERKVLKRRNQKGQKEKKYSNSKQVGTICPSTCNVGLLILHKILLSFQNCFLWEILIHHPLPSLHTSSHSRNDKRPIGIK